MTTNRSASFPAAVVADVCVGCTVDIEWDEDSSKYLAYIAHYGIVCNEIPPGWPDDSCARCQNEPECEFWSDTEWFEDWEVAHIWAWGQSGCPDNSCLAEQAAEFTNVEYLLSVGREGPARAVAALLVVPESRFWLNVERNAIQGVGCRETVGFHRRIDQDLVQEIAEEIERLTGRRHLSSRALGDL
jgi:hypothetical protein